MHLTFWVDEAPAPEPRHRTRVVHGRDGRAFASTYTPGRADRFKRAARAALVDAARAAGLAIGPGAPMVPADGAAHVHLDLALPRPPSHLRGNGVSLTRRAPELPTRRGTGDCDNFAKAVLDALGPWRGPALAWEDDCVVVGLSVQKRYATPGERPGCRVTIQVLALAT